MSRARRIEVDTCGGRLLSDRPTALAETLGGRQRRAARIMPERLSLRLAFAGLRCLVSEGSTVADWTRTWRCRWVVDLRLSGGGRLGPYDSRDAAREAELGWLRERDNEMAGQKIKLGGRWYVDAEGCGEILKVSVRRVTQLCGEGRLDGAERIGRPWWIPVDSARAFARLDRPTGIVGARRKEAAERRRKSRAAKK